MMFLEKDSNILQLITRPFLQEVRDIISKNVRLSQLSTSKSHSRNFQNASNNPISSTIEIRCFN